MASTTSHELLQFTAPTMLVAGDVSADDSGPLPIKGFASIERSDRSDEVVDPQEFDIPTFMAAPTLLMNHRFWTDWNGNQVAIGRVLTMHAAKLTRNSEDDTVWNVKELKSSNILTTMPKVKVPKLKSGDRGLFVTAEVTIPEVKAMVIKGELGGISWRGLTIRETELDPKTYITRTRLREIDLYEVSLVHIPAGNQSTFVVGKSAGNGKMTTVEDIKLEDVRLWRVDLPKDRFVTSKMAEEFLKHHSLAPKIAFESADSWVAIQHPDEEFDLTKTVRVKMADSYMLMAPLKGEAPAESDNEAETKATDSFELVAELVDPAKSSITPLQGVSTMADQGTDTKDVTDASANDASAQDTQKPQDDKGTTTTLTQEQKDAAAKEEAAKAAAEASLSQLGEKVGGHVAEALKPVLSGMVETMTGINDSLKTITAKMADGATQGTPESTTKTTDKEEAAKSVSLEDIMAQIAALGKSIPSEGHTRDEKIDTSKSADTEEADPNACFDTAFPL